MIFQQPWAWLGLLAIALPVAAHLLARRPARRQRFPHLRFLPASAFRPVKRDRIADAGLLAVRAAIVAAAAAALAAPLWRPPAPATTPPPRGSFPGEGTVRETNPGVATVTGGLPLLTSAALRDAADAARSAAATTPGWPEAIRADRPVAIVFPEHEARAALADAAAPLDQPWMREVYFGVLADPLVRAAADADGTSPRDWITAARGPATAAGAGTAARAGEGALLLFVDRPTASVAAAAAIGAAARALSADPAASVSRTDVAAEAARASTAPPPAATRSPAPGGGESSDGRWVWMLVLLLIGIETIVRRRRPAAPQPEAEVARVA